MRKLDIYSNQSYNRDPFEYKLLTLAKKKKKIVKDFDFEKVNVTKTIKRLKKWTI